jgi:predicted  nucleic acid-binding Zn-ribbon protein
MKAKDFIPTSKPRNFVVKNQKTSGAGVHKDKKKAVKQGDQKHKNRQFTEAEEIRDRSSIQKEISELEKQIDTVRSATNKAKNITREVKYFDFTDIIVRIQTLAETAGVDMAEFESKVGEVQEAVNAVESAVYGLDDVFVDLYRTLETRLSDLEYELEDMQYESLKS